MASAAILVGIVYCAKLSFYVVKHSRIVRANAGESYINLGPGRREWSLFLLCLNDLLKYDGTPTGTTGQQYRDALKTSYTNSVGTTINFTDPLNGTAIAVHFDSYEETVRDLHSQIISLATGGSAGASYEVKVVLVEA